MTQRMRVVVVAMLAVLAIGSGVSAQESFETPIRLEVGGAPGGGLFFTGGDGDTEANFNVYTFSTHADYYLTQKLAVEGEYMFGNGWGQDVLFRNGLLVGQQLPFSHAFTGGLLFFPRGTTGTRLPFYVGGGVGLMSMVARPATTKIGYDPDVNHSESFMTSRIGVGMKIPRGVSAPNWAFRVDYRLMFISANDGAPEFFAHDKTRTAHQVQFGIQYALRR